MFDTMESAVQRLDICTYILGKDAFGEQAIAQMIACLERGVRIVERFVAGFLQAKLFGRRSPLFDRQFSPYRGVQFSDPIVA